MMSNDNPKKSNLNQNIRPTTGKTVRNGNRVSAFQSVSDDMVYRENIYITSPVIGQKDKRKEYDDSLARDSTVRPESNIMAVSQNGEKHGNSRSLRGYDVKNHRSQQAREKPNDFGIVVAIKEAFGFIQPIVGEEQIYFSERDYYTGIKTGDEVCFIKRSGSRGFHAERVTKVNDTTKVFIENVKALISKEPDGRSLIGLLEIMEESKGLFMSDSKLKSCLPQNGTLIAVPYFNEDIVSTTRSPKKLLKGDEVSFTLAYIPESAYCKAINVVFSRTKRSRIISEQIQQMLALGVKREQGIIDTLKNNEYGFIRPVERPEQIYFRADDLVDDSTTLEEGMDVEFFVIAESVKGKLCDRAVHLCPLPKGTVQFERSIATNVIGYVLKESIHSPEEKPGVIKLSRSIPTLDENDKSKIIETIELWQRCIPDDLILCAGDEIEVDIQHYRPENLYFARNVRVKLYQPLSREYGVIFSIKEHGFGFIRSYIRDMDLYFRTSDVRDYITGNLVPESNLYVNQVLSFNVSFDEGNSKGPNSNANAPKLKALRIQTAYKCENNQGIVSHTEMTCDDTKYTHIASGLRGIVIRDAGSKRESQPGQIKILPKFYNIIQPLVKDKMYSYDSDLTKHVENFLNNPILNEITIKHLTSGQRKAYHDLLDSVYGGKLGHESVDLPKDSFHPSDPGKGIVLRIYKYANGESNVVKDKAKKNVSGMLDDDLVLFMKEDVQEIYGPLARELEVEFSVFFDKRTMKKVGKEIRLTDDPIVDDKNNAVSVCYGVIDTIVGVKSGRFGFIRSIPNDEKLFWHSTAFLNHYNYSTTNDGNKSGDTSLECDSVNPKNGNSIVTTVNVDMDSILDGQEVSFLLRRRGGMRCAVNITILPLDYLNMETTLSGYCLAMAVDQENAIIIDCADCYEIQSKLWDINFLSDKSIPSNNSNIKDNVSANGKVMNKNDISDIKYFNPLPRDPIPLTNMDNGGTANSESISYEVSIGSIITCQVVCNYGVQRQPVRLLTSHGMNTVNNKVMEKLQGVITKVKVRGDIIFYNKDSTLQSIPNNCHMLEFCEIKVSNNSTNIANKCHEDSDIIDNDLHYCLYNEICIKKDILNTSTRESIQIGEKIDFYRYDSYHVAFNPMLVPKIQFRNPNEMKGSAVNKPKSSGAPTIVMAKGPENDAAVGFEKGWREDRDTETLPWGHLLVE